jgi:hypothetical protein
MSTPGSRSESGPEGIALWLFAAPLAVCELTHHEPLPDLPYDDEDEPVALVTHTEGHTIIAPASYLPANLGAEIGWRAFRVDASAMACVELVDEIRDVAPEAFCVVTFGTKLLLLRDESLSDATRRLTEHSVAVFGA